MTVWMKKVGQQAVGSTADLAANALDADAIFGFLGDSIAFVKAPAEQHIDGLAVGMGTTIRNSKNVTTSVDGFNVFFDGTGRMLYNDHVVEIPPLVVGLAACTRREVSSFLSGFATIIPVDVLSVKFYTCCRCVYIPSRLINLCDREWSGSGALVEPDHLI
jgi:hypothetical protein